MNGYSTELNVGTYNVWVMALPNQSTYLGNNRVPLNYVSVLPSLYLIPSVNFISGDGSKNNPYIID